MLLLPSTSSPVFYADLILVSRVLAQDHIADPIPQPGHGFSWISGEWLSPFCLDTPGKCLLLTVAMGSYLRFDAMFVCSGVQPVGFPQGAWLQTTPQKWVTSVALLSGSLPCGASIHSCSFSLVTWAHMLFLVHRDAYLISECGSIFSIF